jgi:hypothetical protein
MTTLEQGNQHPCSDCGRPTTPHRPRTPADAPYESLVQIDGEWWLREGDDQGDDPGVPVDHAWEWYAVRDEIWAQVHGARSYLCIGCLERRLGRRLVPSDFIPSRMNAPSLVDSSRLADRLGR